MKQLYNFLSQLSDNNNREWFAEHKAEYEALRAEWLQQVQILINELAVYDPALRHVQAKDCAYRIYRDTRFSHDKTPYKTYFSALISPRGRHFDRACYYLHMGPDESALYVGLWNPEGRVLKKLRKAIVDNVDEFRETYSSPEAMKYFPEWWGRQLKTAPQGYDRDHPDIDLLRLTEYGRCNHLTAKFFEKPGWQREAARRFALLKPLNDFLNYSIDE